MRRLSRERISALRLSFETWPDVTASGFRKGRVRARNRVARVFMFYPRSTIQLRQSDYELRVRDGFGH
jgi:hypothetical protein